MGGGTYNVFSRSARLASSGVDYSSMSTHQIFTQRELSVELDPSGIVVRESRDSEEHPNSVPIMIFLDVTGSMGMIPKQLIDTGLPEIMGKLLQSGIDDPQLFIGAIGDHECDRAPLQVSQFESSDESIDKWIEKIYVEGNGGGNSGESYLLAWYFAAQHTIHDRFQKRKKKGILFTIGDEPTLKQLSGNAVNKIMGTNQQMGASAPELLEEAQKTYDVFHIHISHRGNEEKVIGGWKEILGDNLIVVKDYRDVSSTIADKCLELLKEDRTSSPSPQTEKIDNKSDSPKEDMML